MIIKVFKKIIYAKNVMSGIYNEPGYIRASVAKGRHGQWAFALPDQKQLVYRLRYFNN